MAQDFKSILKGFAIGFLLTLIGVSFEHWFHGNPMNEILSEFHHYVAPILLGIAFGIFSFLQGRKGRQHQVLKNTANAHEIKYNTLFDSMIDVVCFLDNDKKIKDINAAATDLYGYSREELIGMSIDELVWHDDKALSDSYFKKLDAQGSYSLYEGRIRTKSGQLKWIQVNSKEILEGGKRSGSQDIIRDITERKQMEIELLEANEQLNKLNLTKDKLYSIIAHDLRSPFNHILGFSSLIQRDIQKERYQNIEEAASHINQSAHHTLQLLENLLSWTKSHTGKLPFEPAVYHAREIILDSVRTLEISARIKDISLDVAVEESLKVHADKGMLSTIFRNLISNAIKYTGEKGKIDITARQMEAHVEFNISDNGVGISQEAMKDLFNEEVNSNTSGTNDEMGSGLGLLLCKELVEINQGRIWIESEVGKGSQVKIVIPSP